MTTTMNITTMTGFAAIQYAEAHGARLRKYADPTEDGRDDLTPDEAIEVAAEDPGLIYITLELDQDLDGDRLAVIEIPEDVETEAQILYAGTYLVAIPPEYDPEIVTGADIIQDGLIRTVGWHEVVECSE